MRRPFSKRNFLIMLFAIGLMGIGVALFKVSRMGNDPSSAFVMAIADQIGIDFSIVLIVFQCICFAFEIWKGRQHIGIGTIVNWFGVGIIASFFSRMISGVLPTDLTLLSRVLLMLAGVLLLSLSASLYQTSRTGIAPYDAVSIIMDEKLLLPYFWCRIITDAACALGAYLLGGIVGIGTLICALGLGPFISFFNRSVSEKLCE